MIPPIKPEPLTASIPADKARGQTRTVGNGEGDKARQYRHHQREGRAAADLHQRRRGVFHFKRFDPEGKGERDTQAPATTIGSI